MLLKYAIILLWMTNVKTQNTLTVGNELSLGGNSENVIFLPRKTWYLTNTFCRREVTRLKSYRYPRIIYFAR